MPSIKSNKDRILEKIDEKISGVLRKFDANPNIKSIDAINFDAEQHSLDRLRTKINTIDEDAPPPKRYLNTNDNFLNTAYHQAVLEKDSQQTSPGDCAGLGKEGKDKAIDEIMDYIKSLSTVGEGDN